MALSDIHGWSRSINCGWSNDREFGSRLAIPMILYSERAWIQGMDFNLILFTELCKCLGIQKMWTTVLHPKYHGKFDKFIWIISSNSFCLCLFLKIRRNVPCYLQKCIAWNNWVDAICDARLAYLVIIYFVDRVPFVSHLTNASVTASGEYAPVRQKKDQSRSQSSKNTLLY